MIDEPVLLSREQWTELCQRAETAEAQAKLSHDMFVGAMADIKSMEREIEAAEARLEAVRGSIQAKRKDGWEGFRNVIYGWCVPLKQINTFFDELEALLKEQTK